MQKRSLYGRPFLLIKKELIRKAGFACQGCGEAFPNRLNETKLAMSGACAVDFKVPLKRGGTVTLENAWVLCWPCFKGKNHDNLTDAEWRARGRPQVGAKIHMRHNRGI